MTVGEPVTSPLHIQRYNMRVLHASSDRASSSKPRAKHHIYEMEATGLLVIAIVLMILTVVRYWQYIAWSAH